MCSSIFRNYLGPVLAASVRFCSCNPSGPSLIQFLPNALSSCGLFLWLLLTHNSRTVRIGHSARLVHVRLVLSPVARILLPKRHVLLHEQDVGGRLLFESLHGKFSNFLIKEVLLIWRGCELFGIHGSLVQEISWFSSRGRFHGRLVT